MRGFVVGVLVLGIAVLTGLLAGCGDGGGPQEPSPERPPVTTPRQPEPSTPRPPAEVTVHGTVQRGVEPNCLVLAAEGRQYLLVEAGPDVRPGVEITVRGTPRPDLATTCMQGTPLVVDHVELGQGGPS